MNDASVLVASDATNDVAESSAQKNSTPVIIIDQSEERPASRTNLLAHAALADGPSLSQCAQSSSNQLADAAAAAALEVRCDGASTLSEASSDCCSRPPAAEKLHCDNIVVQSQAIVVGNALTAATYHPIFEEDAAAATTTAAAATVASAESGISSKNDESIDTTTMSTSSSSNEVVINGEPSTLLTNCIGFDRFDFTDHFVENASKMETQNDDDGAVMASNLITSETMSDFFDEIYDTNYVNYGRRRTDVDDDGDGGDDVAYGRRRKERACHATVTGDQEFESRGRLVGQLRDDCAVIKSSLKRSALRAVEPTPLEYLPIKKSKKGITFDSVSVYYFPRTQGFTCIPSQGGSTLGMSWNHSHIRKYSLGEHAAEQRRAHRQQCSQQLASARNWNELSNVSSEDSDSDEIISEAELDCENYNFLQPIPTRERRTMLRSAGIHKIDSREKDECRTIRLSREFCGCTCQIYCDPERCVCAQAGIKCQVDRMNFPCSCTREGCANENGRIEFNPLRVRTHFIHTLMRLEMEKKQDDPEDEPADHRLLLSGLENASQPTSYTISSASPVPSSSLSALPSSSFAPPPSSSNGGCAAPNVLSPFSYHPDPLSSFYSPQQPSPYDDHVSSTSAAASDPSQSSAAAAFVGYGSHQYDAMMGEAAAAAAAVVVDDDDSTPSYSQLSSVSSLALLGDGAAAASSLAAAAAEYAAMSGEHCIRLATSVTACYGDAGGGGGDDDDVVVSTLSEMPQMQLRQTFHDVNEVTAAAAAVVPMAAPSAYQSDGAFVALAGDDTSKEFSLECQSDGENANTSIELCKDTGKDDDESDSENFGDIIKKTMVESVIA